MEPYVTELYEALQVQLAQLEASDADFISKAREAVALVTASLRDLRQHLSAYQWEAHSEEIHFFKHVKPKFQAKLIYYLRIFHLESRSLVLAADSFKALLEEELACISRFFERNRDFHEYYMTGAGYLDEWFFIRNQFDLNLVDDELFMALDPDFTTVHSYKASRLLAYHALTDYLQGRLYALRMDEGPAQGSCAVSWTAKKTDLVELIYALHAAGVVNHAKADVNLLAKILEAVFGVNLGNYYRAFQDIRARKKNRTPFLDLLKETLLQRMETADLRLYEGSL